MQDFPTLMWAIKLVVWWDQYHQGNVLTCRCAFPKVIYVVCTVVHIKHSFVLHVYTIYYILRPILQAQIQKLHSTQIFDSFIGK